jgi:hypothetical protein
LNRNKKASGIFNALRSEFLENGTFLSAFNGSFYIGSNISGPTVQ